MPFDVTLPDGTVVSDVPDGFSRAQLTQKLASNGYDVSKLGADVTNTSAPSAAKGSAMAGYAMGFRDPIDAGAQLLRRAVPDSVGNAIDAVGNKLADWGLPVARSNGVAGVDQIVQNANQDYNQSRALAGRQDENLPTVFGHPVDLPRIAGNIFNPVNRAVPIQPTVGAMGLIGRSVAQGAISGAMTPVSDTNNFGADKAWQVLGGGAIGGVASPIISGIGSLLGKGVNAVKSMVSPAAAAPDASGILKEAAESGGVNIDSLAPEIRSQMEQNLSKALANGKTLDPQAALRIAEGQQVLGPQAGLTVGQATRDPGQFTKEMNTRGIAGLGEPLTQRYADQGKALLNAIDIAGAAKAPGSYDAGQSMINALKNADQQASSKVSSLYDQAKALNAGDLTLDGSKFADQANAAVKAAGRDLYVPSNIQKVIDQIGSGQRPLNISSAEQYKSIIGQDIAKAQAANDGATAHTLGLIRNALDNAEPMANQGAASDAIAAFNTARATARQRFQANDANPAMQSVIKGVEPDRFFDKFVKNGNANDLQRIVDTAPDAKDAIRNQLVGYLKDSATSGAENDVAKFSQASYNKVLNKIGENKLATVFSPEEIDQLKRIGRVASYIQVQPTGAAVNNSNTAAAALNLLAGQGTNFIPHLGPYINTGAKMLQSAQQKSFIKNALSGQIPTQTVPAQPNSINPLLLRSIGGTGFIPSGGTWSGTNNSDQR